MDLILCATKTHKAELNVRYPELKEKIFTLKEYVKMDKDGTDLDIKDPWGFNINTFRICAAEISVCIDKIIDELAK